MASSFGSRGFRIALLATVFTSVGAFPAAAQEVNDGGALASTDPATVPEGLEEIIVTAQKRVEPLQNVPVSITAFSEQRIEQQDLRTTKDIINLTPNLSVFTSNRNTAYYVMRGLPVIFGEPNVGVFVDGVYQGSRSNLDSELTNIERVEILRGPQNTLYGRNTFAGAINYYTKKPGNDFTGRVQLSLAEYGQRDADASLGGPVIRDKLYARLSGSVRSREGFYENELTGEKGDRRNVKTGTATIRATPTPDLDITIKASHERVRDGDYLFQLFPSNALPNASGINAVFVGSGPFPNTFSFTPGYFDRNGTYISVNAQWTGDVVSITSVSGYNHVNANSLRDTDYIAGRFQENRNHEVIDEYSSELRLSSSNNSSPLQWLIAASYYKFNSKIDNRLNYLADNPTAIALGLQTVAITRTQNQSETEGRSVFGQISYPIFKKLRLTGGLRYDHDKKSFEQTSTVFGASTTYPGLANPGSVKFNLWSWKVAADYEVTPDIMLFASAALGQRAGGFNADGALLPSERLFAPEKINSYELGIKSEWFGRRLRANLTGFYVIWKNQQNSTGFFRGPSLLKPIVNTPDGSEPTSKGVEIELLARPLDELTLGFNYGYTDSTYDEFDLSVIAAAIGVPASEGILDGNRQVLTPKHTLSASAFYQSPINDGWEAFAGLTYRHEGMKFASQFNFDAVGPSNVVDTNIGVTNGQFRLTVFAKNLFKDKYAESRTLGRAWTTPGFPTRSGFGPSDPQQFGVRVEANF